MGVALCAPGICVCGCAHGKRMFLCGIVWVCTWQMHVYVCMAGMCGGVCVHNRLMFLCACVCGIVCVWQYICFCVCEREILIGYLMAWFCFRHCTWVCWLLYGLVLFQTIHLRWLFVTLWLDFVSDTTPEIFVGYSMAWFCFRHYTWDCWLLYGLVLFQTLHLRCFLLLYGLICFRYYTWDVCWLLYGLVCFRPGTSQWVDSTSMLTGSLTALCVSDSATQSTDIFVCFRLSDTEWVDGTSALTGSQTALFVSDSAPLSEWVATQWWLVH